MKRLADTLGLTPHLRRVRRFIRPTLREKVASQFIHGHGIELGALHRCFPVDTSQATVRYVDRLSRDDLRRHYPELEGHDLIPADVIDDAESLATIPDRSQDFCIASHVVEHMEDPIHAVGTWLRVTRPEGVVVIAVPLPDNPLDRFREPTSVEHLRSDHGLKARDPDEWSRRRREHFLEYTASMARVNHRYDERTIEADAARLESTDYSIHFHVFSDATLTSLVGLVSETTAIPFETVAHITGDEPETILVLQRIG